MQAAKEVGLPVCFAAWNEFGQWKRRMSTDTGWVVKIDPPLWESCRLDELGALADGYQKQLAELSGIAQGGRIGFLNQPAAIAKLLDKYVCKEELLKAGLPVTEPLYLLEGGRQACNADVLFEWMRQRRVFQIFLKPVYGSGAAGVSAFRWQPLSGRMVLYTCAVEHPHSGLVNTKRLRRFAEPKTVARMLDRILGLGCILERWHAKAEYQGMPYDLRAVVQDGYVDFMLARLSKGPITNLHLNNHPLDIKELNLPADVLENITNICIKAAGCFSGLQSVGIDLLLEKGSQKPLVVEMNAQGDLIYQDIFQENRIYRHQAAMMKSCVGQV